VDNPISACMSCHGTAQMPVAAALSPFAANCNTDALRLQWFRNIRPDEPFGDIDEGTCTLVTPSPPLTSLDYSLQMTVAAQNVLLKNDVNPCVPPTAETMTAKRRSLPPNAENAPRIGRGGFVE